jgi:hypothetical protein
MSQGMKLFVTAVTVLLTLSILGGAFYLFNGGMALFDRGKTQMTGKGNVALAAQFAPYQNKFVNGQEVLDAISTYYQQPAFAIKVITGNSPSGFYMNNSVSGGSTTSYAQPAAGDPVDTTNTSTALPVYTLLNMQDTTNVTAYVNPTGRFQSQVYADAGNEVRLVVFIQR